MKLTILLLFALLPPAWGQNTTRLNPDCSIPFTFTATGRSAIFVNDSPTSPVGCVNWVITYQSTGFSAVSLRVDSAADSSGVPGAWGAFSGVILDGNAAGALSGPGVNPNTDTNWGFTLLKGAPAWVSVNLVSKTGTGTISGTLAGIKPRGVDQTIAPIAPTCPVGPQGAIQFYDTGVCAGDAFFTYDKTTATMTVTNETFALVTPPTAPTATLVATGTGNVTNGDHVWLVTYVTATGESAPGAISNAVTVDGTHKQVNLTGIPVSGDSRVLSKNVYQTKADGSGCSTTGTPSAIAPCTSTDYRNFFLLANISNATTSYSANTDDGSLGAVPPFDSTGGFVYTGGLQIGKWDNRPNGIWLPNFVMNRNGAFYVDTTAVSGVPHRQTAFHFCCGNNVYENTFFGLRSGNLTLSGHDNTGFGVQTLPFITSANFNTCLGARPCYNFTSASENVAVGLRALFHVITNTRNVAIGNDAGPADDTTTNTISIGSSASVSVSNRGVFGDQNITDFYFGSEAPSAQTHAASGAFVPFAFANRATVLPNDSDRGYCSDCTVTSGIDNTCAGSGNGANAYRVNGVYKCFQ